MSSSANSAVGRRATSMLVTRCSAMSGYNHVVMEELVEEVVPLRGRELRVLRPRDAEALLDEEAFEREEFLPYWAELWPSGVALARAVAARALRGRRVVELGCGLGLPSLTAALQGGRVLATDWSREAINLLAANAERSAAVLE